MIDERKLSTGRRAIDARIKANDALKSWGVNVRGRASHDRYHQLQRLCGKKPHGNWRQNFDEHDLAVCEALCGSNGYTVYKALLAKIR